MIRLPPNRFKRLNKRSRLQLFVDILNAINKGECKPTRIMYKSNLSWLPLKRMLNRMVELELIERKKKGTRQIFLIAEKGKDFLRILDDLKRVLIPLSNFSDNIDSIICTFDDEAFYG